MAYKPVVGFSTTNLGVGSNAPTYSTQTSNALKGNLPSTNNSKGTVMTNDVNPVNRGGISTKTGGGSTGGTVARTTAQPSQPTYNPDAEAERRRAEEERIRAERENQIRSNISASYDPIFAELDRQLGDVSGQQQQLSSQVDVLAGQQKQDTEFERDQRLKEIEGYRADEASRSKSTLRDMEGNIRNLLQASALYLGSRGAQDSSAAIGASEGITQAADKTRGKILGARDDAYRQLDQKAIQIGDIASQQMKKIDDFKTNKLFEITQWAADRVNSLKGQMATAQGEKARAIAQLIEGTQQQFVDRIRQIDDEVSSYKKAVQTWQDQRAAEMQDFIQKSSIASSYSSTTPGTYRDLTDAFGNTALYNDKTGQVMPISLAGVGSDQEMTKKPGFFQSIGQSLGLIPNEDPRTQVQL